MIGFSNLGEAPSSQTLDNLEKSSKFLIIWEKFPEKHSKQHHIFFCILIVRG